MSIASPRVRPSLASIVADVTDGGPNAKPNDLNQSRILLKQDRTLIAVIEMSLSNWLVAGIVPGVERQPLKKLAVDESALLKLLNRWRDAGSNALPSPSRPAGTGSGWRRWLTARGIEAHVIHASSVAVSREHRRAKPQAFAVGTAITGRPPHRSGLARLRHPAPTSGV
jgi:hypothetical protein